MTGPAQAVRLPLEVLDTLLPMHVLTNPGGHIVSMGRTLRKISPGEELDGRRFLDVFEIERPMKLTRTNDLGDLKGARLKLRFRGHSALSLKGVLTRLEVGEGYLVDLSFGISAVAAVTEYALTGADFAPSDQTVEMLYLAEANAAAMSEARRLIQRLEVSRDAASLASLTDGLTGLGNRRALDDWLAARVSSGNPFALFQIDLDYFKSVNDTHGHVVGDAVLQTAARRLREALRPGDDLARVGGDEFVALLNDRGGAQRLEEIAQRLIDTIEEPVLIGAVSCRISASIGIATSEDYAKTAFADMVADADAALYAAKRRGRGRAVFQTG